MKSEKVRIGLAGYSGFIGTALRERSEGLEIVPLKRELLYGDIEELRNELREVDVVMNLAGYPIARRWTPGNRKKIRESRSIVNRNLVEAVNGLGEKTGSLISASAIGLYSNNGIHSEMEYNEGKGFIANVVREWEAPLVKLEKKKKCVVLRIGIVLGKDGGAMVPLNKMARFRMVPVMGSGRQSFSFIHVVDLVESIKFIIHNKLDGIFNMCSPEPTDYTTFAKTMAQSSKGILFRIPAPMLNLVMGKAHQMLTEGQHVVPERLIREGYRFRYPDIAGALENLLHKS